jgi:hypothetical protein
MDVAAAVGALRAHPDRREGLGQLLRHFVGGGLVAPEHPDARSWEDLRLAIRAVMGHDGPRLVPRGWAGEEALRDAAVLERSAAIDGRVQPTALAAGGAADAALFRQRVEAVLAACDGLHDRLVDEAVAYTLMDCAAERDAGWSRRLVAEVAELRAQLGQQGATAGGSDEFAL